jgi:hypothetical protein
MTQYWNPDSRNPELVEKIHRRRREIDTERAREYQAIDDEIWTGCLKCFKKNSPTTEENTE